MHSTAADGGLRGHVPARPECITPHIRFLFIAPQFRIGLPSDPASRRRPCPSPCLRLCKTWPSDFHRRSNAPCLAHTFKFRGLRRSYCAAPLQRRVRPLAHATLPTCNSQYCLWICACDSQQNPGSAARLFAALLPSLQGANRHANERCKLGLRQPSFLSRLNDRR